MNYFFFLEASMLICLGVHSLHRLRGRRKKSASLPSIPLFSTLCAFASYLGFYFNCQGFITLSEFNAPLPALASTLYFVVLLCTPRTKFIAADKPFPSSLLLISQALSLLICSSFNNSTLFLLLALEPLIPLVDLLRRGERIRIFLIHWVPAWLIAITLAFANNLPNEITGCLITILVILRMGIFPGHTWIIYLTEKCCFTLALLFITPMTPILILLKTINSSMKLTQAFTFLGLQSQASFISLG